MAFELDPPSEEIRLQLETLPYPPADQKFVRFYGRPKRNEEKSKAEGRPVFEEAEFVEIHTAGDKDNVVDRPVREIDRYFWPEKYVAYRNGKTQDMGTPLAVWGVVSPERIEELAYFKIRTVEQLADVPDGTLPKLGMGARGERDKAKAYLDALKGAAPVAELRAENDALRARLDALERLTQGERALDTAETIVEVNPAPKPKRVRKQVAE